jgi:hypothetical protein
VRSAHRPTGSVAWPGGVTWASQPGAQQSAQPGVPSNEPAQQTQHRDPLLHSLLTDRMGTC